MATHATRVKSARGTQKAKEAVPLLKEIEISTEALTFAKSIEAEYDHRLAIWDIECGLHSGFPKCCVLFFVTVWRPMAIMGMFEIMDAYKATCTLMRLENAGYVMCPACLLARNVVKVKRCNCSERVDKELLLAGNFLQ